MAERVPSSQSTSPAGWEQARQAISDLKAASDTPSESFSGSKAIYCANLEGFLGGRFPVLLAERDELLQRLTDGASLPPDGIEDHIGHRVEIVGGEDALLGLMCADCGEYVIEWES